MFPLNELANSRDAEVADPIKSLHYVYCMYAVLYIL